MFRVSVHFKLQSFLKIAWVDSGEVNRSYQSPLQSDLGKEMATHCSILAWRISRTEEPGGLQSIGWQRVRHD